MNEKEQLRRKIKELEEQNEQLTKALQKARDVIANAKDVDPVQRVTEKRIRKMADNAFLSLVRHKVRGWIVRMGNKSQWYKSLREIWEILKKESWDLSEIIPESLPSKMVQESIIFSSLVDTKADDTTPAAPKEESTVLSQKPRDYNSKVIPPVKRNPELVKLCRQDARNRNYATPKVPTFNKPLLPKAQWWNSNLVPAY